MWRMKDNQQRYFFVKESMLIKVLVKVLESVFQIPLNFFVLTKLNKQKSEMRQCYTPSLSGKNSTENLF